MLNGKTCKSGGKFAKQNSIHIKRIEAGASPNETISASESKSAPMADFTFKRRAARPSKKSKIAAQSINNAAVNKNPFKANTAEIAPVNALQQVRKLGICFFTMATIPVTYFPGLPLLNPQQELFRRDPIKMYGGHNLQPSVWQQVI